MLTAVIAAACIVAWILLGIGCLLLVTGDLGGWSWMGGLCLVAWLVGTFAAVIYIAQQDEAQGPCLREETRYMLVGKVMTPYTACVERGTWKKANR